MKTSAWEITKVKDKYFIKIFMDRRAFTDLIFHSVESLNTGKQKFSYTFELPFFVNNLSRLMKELIYKDKDERS